MKTKKPARTAARADDVEGFVAALEHPHKDAILKLRTLVQRADARVTEAIKWNAPSFALGEHFATFNLKTKQGVLLVMHLGAKKRPASYKRAEVADPTGLLKWLADDRATIAFADLADVKRKQKALVAVVRAWIATLPD